MSNSIRNILALSGDHQSFGNHPMAKNVHDVDSMQLLQMIRNIPALALIPLVILWFGIGEPSKVATIALGVFFPMAIATYSGVDQVPRTLIRMAQSFDVPAFAIVTGVCAKLEFNAVFPLNVAFSVFPPVVAAVKLQVIVWLTAAVAGDQLPQLPWVPPVPSLSVTVPPAAVA